MWLHLSRARDAGPPAEGREQQPIRQRAKNKSTHLVLSLAEEERDERQTFELQAKGTRNRLQVRGQVPLSEGQEERKNKARGNNVWLEGDLLAGTQVRNEEDLHLVQRLSTETRRVAKAGPAVRYY